MNKENILNIIEMISEIFAESGMSLDIYNYRGILKEKSSKKTK